MVWGEVPMGGYLPHINRLFVVFTHCTRSCSRNTTVFKLHAMISIVRLARDFDSLTWRHWCLRRCQCDATEPSVARVQSVGAGSVAWSKPATMWGGSHNGNKPLTMWSLTQPTTISSCWTLELSNLNEYSFTILCVLAIIWQLWHKRRSCVWLLKCLEL
jgi:hypothetical protein